MFYLYRLGALGARVLLMFLLLLLIYGLPITLHAATRLNAPDFFTNVTLRKNGSPYIVDGDMVMEWGATLTVEPGVSVLAATTTSLPFKPFINAIGNIKMLGTPEEPIKVSGLPILVRGKENVFQNVIFESSSLAVIKSATDPWATTTFTGTVLSLATTSLKIEGGTVSISNSEIKNNETGIVLQGRASSSVLVRNSIFENNAKNHIQNSRPENIQADMNWWGNESGPGRNVSGVVTYSPWLTSDPRIKKVECCSNVLFIPGIQASRLYRDDKDLLGGGTTTHRAWEPYSSNDVRSLFLGSSGESTNSTIKPRGIIDSAYGLKNIYKNFIAMMDGEVAEKTINVWVPFSYDWRMGVDEVAKKLVPLVLELASTSKTSKVTVIAHSNGGLVTKILGNELEKIGKEGILDKVLFVAVPQLGTPQAVASLLTGDGLELLGGIVMKSSLGKEWSQNMLGAYGLLPSQEFFSRIVDPVVTLAGKAIGSYENFTKYLTEKNLSSNLLSKSKEIHSLIDTWKFPSTTLTASIAGWGLPTTKTIEYGSSTPRMKKDIGGDGTVVVGSADASAPTLYFNQGLYNFDQHMNSSHADILETDVVKNFISKIIATTSLTVHNMYSSYLTTDKPSTKLPWNNFLTLSVHSPVDMDVYDSKGGHMGLIDIPGAPADADLKWFENTIGGQYDFVGEEKYYTVPADETYTVKLKGTGIGNFTFQVQKFMGEDMTEVANIVYADLPVTPLLEATTTVTSLSLSSPLNIDVDGNGTTDIRAEESKEANPQLYLDSIKTIITSLGLDKKEEKLLLKRIEKIRTLIDSKKEQFIKKLATVTQKIDSGHWNLRSLTEDDKNLLNSMFDSLLSSLESS